jgi:hypothetical protein
LFQAPLEPPQTPSNQRIKGDALVVAMTQLKTACDTMKIKIEDRDQELERLR